MSDHDSEQYIKFRKWLRQPNAQFEKQPLTNDMEGMKQYLEEIFWEAWQAGYNEALADAQAAFASPVQQIRSQLDAVESNLRALGNEDGAA